MSFRIDPSGDNIILRSPDFSNVIRIDGNDIRRYTRGGTLKVFVDTNWPAFITHIYKFSVIKKAIIDALRTFLETNAGLEITVLDHLGNTMDGYVTSPINEIIAVRPDCTYAVGFEFMEKPV
jgi:hypothetical protein